MLPFAGFYGVGHDRVGLVRQLTFTVRYDIPVPDSGAAGQNRIDQTCAHQPLQTQIAATGILGRINCLGAKGAARRCFANYETESRTQ